MSLGNRDVSHIGVQNTLQCANAIAMRNNTMDDTGLGSEYDNDSGVISDVSGQEEEVKRVRGSEKSDPWPCNIRQQMRKSLQSLVNKDNAEQISRAAEIGMQIRKMLMLRLRRQLPINTEMIGDEFDCRDEKAVTLTGHKPFPGQIREPNLHPNERQPVLKKVQQHGFPKDKENIHSVKKSLNSPCKTEHIRNVSSEEVGKYPSTPPEQKINDAEGTCFSKEKSKDCCSSVDEDDRVRSSDDHNDSSNEEAKTYVIKDVSSQHLNKRMEKILKQVEHKLDCNRGEDKIEINHQCISDLFINMFQMEGKNDDSYVDNRDIINNTSNNDLKIEGRTQDDVTQNIRCGKNDIHIKRKTFQRDKYTSLEKQELIEEEEYSKKLKQINDNVEPSPNQFLFSKELNKQERNHREDLKITTGQISCDDQKFFEQIKQESQIYPPNIEAPLNNTKVKKSCQDKQTDKSSSVISHDNKSTCPSKNVAADSNRELDNIAVVLFFASKTCKPFLANDLLKIQETTKIDGNEVDSETIGNVSKEMSSSLTSLKNSESKSAMDIRKQKLYENSLDDNNLHATSSTKFSKKISHTNLHESQHSHLNHISLRFTPRSRSTSPVKKESKRPPFSTTSQSEVTINPSSKTNIKDFHQRKFTEHTSSKQCFQGSRINFADNSIPRIIHEENSFLRQRSQDCFHDVQDSTDQQNIPPDLPGARFLCPLSRVGISSTSRTCLPQQKTRRSRSEDARAKEMFTTLVNRSPNRFTEEKTYAKTVHPENKIKTTRKRNLRYYRVDSLENSSMQNGSNVNQTKYNRRSVSDCRSTTEAERAPARPRSLWQPPPRVPERGRSPVRLREHANWNLLRAVDEGRTAEVVQLLELGADVNHASAGKWTLLHRAVRKGHVELVSALLELGANVHARTSFGFSPLHVAAYADTSGWCTALLLRAGAPADERNSSGRTPLHAAAEAGNVKALQVLLEFGANRNLTNNDRKTPLQLAKTDAIRRLLLTTSY